MPRYHVNLADSAEADFDRIIDYLIDNDFDIDTARRIRTKIIDTLSSRPLTGVIYDRKRDIRKVLIMRKNSVYYRVVDGEVRVLYIRAGRMDKDI